MVDDRWKKTNKKNI